MATCPWCVGVCVFPCASVCAPSVPCLWMWHTVATGLCVSNNMAYHDDDQLAVIVHSCSLCRVYTFLTIAFNSQAEGLSVLTHCQVVSELLVLIAHCTLHLLTCIGAGDCHMLFVHLRNSCEIPPFHLLYVIMSVVAVYKVRSGLYS